MIAGSDPDGLPVRDGGGDDALGVGVKLTDQVLDVDQVQSTPAEATKAGADGASSSLSRSSARCDPAHLGYVGSC